MLKPIDDFIIAVCIEGGRAALVSHNAVVPPLVYNGGVFVTLIAWQGGYCTNALQSL